MYRQDVSSACRHVCLYTLRRRRRGFFEGEPRRGRRVGRESLLCSPDAISMGRKVHDRRNTFRTRRRMAGRQGRRQRRGRRFGGRDTKRVLKNARSLQECGSMYTVMWCEFSWMHRSQSSMPYVRHYRMHEERKRGIAPSTLHILGFYYVARMIAAGNTSTKRM